eukprot:GEMP01018727.1.p1 GENE.GEMP01018727.1~~GEMP01018727.1.p1  ORF type:complete len:498 (+),score=96.09 GEMP01018727.1:402-1895(+)
MMNPKDVSIRQLAGAHQIISLVGRQTEEKKHFVLRCMDPKAYRQEMEPSGDGKADYFPKDQAASIADDMPNTTGSSPPKGTKHNTACFANTSREDAVQGETSRTCLRRTFTEYNGDHDAPPPGHYNPNFILAKLKDHSADFTQMPITTSIKEYEPDFEPPLSPAPIFGNEVSRPGPFIYLANARPNLSMISHRERHLKAMADTDKSFTGFTPCDQHAVEQRNPCWNFHSASGRAGMSQSSYYLPGRYADNQGEMPLGNRPTVKQGRRFDYKRNAPMKATSRSAVTDLSLSRIIPLVSRSNSQALWHRTKSVRNLVGPIRSEYLEKDADVVYALQMNYSPSRSDGFLRQRVKLSPRFEATIDRKKHNYGHRLFQGDRALRGACGLNLEVSLEHEQLPVERTAECDSVKRKVSCPIFQKSIGRTETRRWSKTPQLKQQTKQLCPPFERQSTGNGHFRKQRPLAPDAELLLRKRQSRSYEELSEWNEALRNVENNRILGY